MVIIFLNNSSISNFLINLNFQIFEKFVFHVYGILIASKTI